ncbi:DNA-directed RNA polymerase subunit B [Candidatus Woesearchaeota archaeon]|nr:DNA-directed RNA polymerase subunit B [Candidatus Woesearchaeota archaeon]
MLMTEVYLNGIYAGEVEDANEFIQQLRNERRKGILSNNINFKYKENEDGIYVESSPGRARRPLVIVKDGKSSLTDAHIKQLQKNELTWKDLVEQGVLEYIDAGEEESTMIALREEDITPEHTHVEISPMLMLGLCTSLVPFSEYCPSSRINGGSKNQKQALGFYIANYPIRMDMDVSLLNSPQKPIVQTIMHDISEYNKHPSGQNVVVAIMSYKGYNMDDSVIINQGSIQRGYGRSTYYRPAVAEQLRYSGGLVDEIGIPDKDVKGYKSEKDYRLLEDDGIISSETTVSEDDVLIGKTSPPRFLSSMDEYNLAVNLRRESSISMKHGEKGVIDFVLVTENSEGNKQVQVRIRETKIPEIGDKFTSRYGQKGVIGLIVPHQDMPFSSSGMIPDLIFSPHGIPSRMTVAHLLESVAGKVGALSGRYIDGTVFDGEKEFDLRDELLRHGFRENGTELMYNGITGEAFEVKVFIGSQYYMKLKHMVSNKMHSRARGPIQLLTRQPTEGRAKEGGLRLGEMEKDTFVAHGASLLLKERFDSDRTILPVCEGSGLLAVHDTFRNKKFSQILGEGAEINDIEMSYAFKLFLDELKSLGIYPKLVLKNKY